MSTSVNIQCQWFSFWPKSMRYGLNSAQVWKQSLHGCTASILQCTDTVSVCSENAQRCSCRHRYRLRPVTKICIFRQLKRIINTVNICMTRASSTFEYKSESERIVLISFYILTSDVNYSIHHQHKDQQTWAESFTSLNCMRVIANSKLTEEK